MSDLTNQLRAWEKAMTCEEIERAIALVRANGWGFGDRPPEYVWATAFHIVAPDKHPHLKTGDRG